jgi:hypothetical protein
MNGDMRDIQMVLERWGGWAASDSSGVDYSSIAAGFKDFFPNKQIPPVMY